MVKLLKIEMKKVIMVKTQMTLQILQALLQLHLLDDEEVDEVVVVEVDEVVT
jgi:hypothetical protein